MKVKVIPKTGTQRNRTRLIVIMFSVMFAGCFLGCAQPPKFIPEELNGKYSATYPGYENQFFELGTELITMGFRDGKYKYYDVKRVEKDNIDNRILYTILCANEDKGEEFNFAFFIDFTGGGIIHFKNKPQVAWKKTRNINILKHNSETQIRH